MVNNPVAKVQSSSKELDSTKLADIIIESIQEKKGCEIIKMDLRRVTGAICDYFIICHGNSHIQVDAIASFVEEEVKNKTSLIAKPKEGYENKQWILLDYFDVVVHVFIPEFREFYDLEGLWADANTSNIKESISPLKQVKT
ncbi:MAG TPA: ribosome silencing factor [Flavobacteriales bacterium]|nr:ribosome silencing factor [Flavobacteriales bacterium]HIA11869.1 ribosome silencing factor [Flavobacteriales bacterium]